MEFDRAVLRRRMVRNYTGEPVAPEVVERVVRRARRAPSAGFTQGQSFVVVTDPSLRARVAEIAGEPAYAARGFDPWISRAPALVVLGTSEEAYRERYREPDKREPAWRVPWWWVDAGCALMVLLLAAVAEGLAAGFLGIGSVARDRELRDLLGIPERVRIVGIVTIGHPAPDRRSRSLARGWRPEEEVLHWERWGKGRP